MNARKIIMDLNKKCSDCGITMIKSSNELMCPKCGLVKELIEGSD
jgi:ribosomal protein S27AE